jgi:hypothetical protein
VGSPDSARQPPSAVELMMFSAQRGTVGEVDEGLPIAYQVLDDGIPVYASDGAQVGTVDHVVSAPAEDIFHGIVIRAQSKQQFVAAEDVASLHERGVDLRIDAAAAAALPEPHGAAPAWHEVEPGVKPKRWTHFVDLLTGKDPRERDWTEED